VAERVGFEPTVGY